MAGNPKTKKQLTDELNSLKRRIAELETVQEKYLHAEQDVKVRDKILEKTVQILETTVDLIFVHDAQGHLAYVNEAAARAHGYTKDELLKIDLVKLRVGKSAELFEKQMKQIMYEGADVYQIEHYRKDGSVLPLEINTRTLEIDGNTLLFSAARDVSERKHTEQELREREARYKYLFEYSQVANALVGLDGTIIDANEAAAELYGYDKGEIVGKNLLEFFSPESAQKAADAIARGLQGEYVGATEFDVVTKKGPKTFFFPGGYHVVVEDGKEIGFLISAIDITERNKAENVLRHSEERYRTILEEMQDGYFEVDLAGNFTFVNDAVCGQLGYPREELMGMNNRNITASDDVEKVYKAFNRVYREGHPVRDFTFKIVRKDGRVGQGELSIFPLRGEKGEIIGFRGVGRDIAERLQIIEDLKRSEERYRTVLDEMEEAYYELDLSGKLTFLNDALVRKAGRSREELIGMPYKEYTPAKDVKRMYEAFSQVYKSGRPLKGIPIQAVKQDGTIISSEDTVLPLRNKAGDVIGFRGLSHDVTERLRMMEALRLSEERYRTMLDEMEEAYYEVDLDGNFTFFSDALCRQLGYSREEIIGMHYKLYIPAENAKKVFDVYNTVFRTGEPRKSFASSQITKSGKLVHTEDSIFPMRDEEGKIIGFRGISRDVTERRQREEERKQLEQKAQFASRLASVGELASGVAHEINNPLTAVIGYAHLLLDRKDIPADIKRDVEVINEGAQRVAGIIKKLLVFARQTKPERTYVDINEIISTTLELRAYSLQSSNIKVILQLDPDLPMTVADPGQMQQVFLNLIMNAEAEVKMVQGGGKLSIKTEQAGDNIRISFKDNGLGIAKENLERIFNPFFTTRKVGQGTGLGLSVCHGIVTEHKGKIWAESHVGKGAAFIVELPVVGETKQFEMPEPVVRETRRAARAKILVVDDEFMVRQFISQILADEGHEVQVADSAEVALEEVTKKEYQAIMLDIKMPGMSGIDLYRHFQKLSPAIADKVVFITGDIMGANTMTFLSKTKAPYIIKPFDAKQLKTEINRVLASG